MDKKKITVIVPIYNTEKYLDDCLKSLVSQTESFDEIILINDGSTDGGEAICERYRGQYANIRLVNQENQGLAIARNVGLEMATGDYVVFVDSDDFVSQEMCHCLKRNMYLDEMEMIRYNAKIQYDLPSKEPQSAFRHKTELDGHVVDGMKYLELSYPRNYTAAAYVSAYKKSFLEENEILFPEHIYFEDNYFSLQVMTNATNILCISDCLYIRRIRENSITSGIMTRKKCEDLVTNQKLIWKYLLKNEKWLKKKELLRQFIAFYVLYTFHEFSSCQEQPEAIKDLKKTLVEEFMKNWQFLLEEDFEHWGFDIASLLILKEQLRLTSGCGDENAVKIFEEREQTEQTVRRCLLRKLVQLPFGQANVKIGIYGIGEHTKLLLEYYRKEVGEIKATLLFFVSTEKEAIKFHDKEVYTCAELPEDIDYILVSSYLYQREMYDNLQKQGVNKDKILLCYEETDVCDLVLCDWVLRQ